jgi:reactive intermediate/imine deaminase
MPLNAVHSPNAPAAIGTYSQAVRAGDTVYLSGQIGLDPVSGELARGIDAQIERVFLNLRAVAEAAQGGFHNVVRVTVYLTDLAHFPQVNDAMVRHFSDPYPARATVGVASLPRGALVEVDAIMHIGRGNSPAERQ